MALSLARGLQGAWRRLAASSHMMGGMQMGWRGLASDHGSKDKHEHHPDGHHDHHDDHGPHFYMDKKEVTERVMHVLRHFDGINESKLTPTASLEKDLGLDSLDRVEFVFALEQEFNITIADESAEKLYEARKRAARPPLAQGRAPTSLAAPVTPAGLCGGRGRLCGALPRSPVTAHLR